MKRNKLAYIFLALALVLFGCEDPNSEKVWDLTFVELDAATTASGSRTYSYKRENDGVNKPSGFIVNLASQPLSEDVNVNFEILGTSTAIANVHYVVNSNSVTIPAGENIAELPIEIIADGIEAGEVLTLNIRLTDSNVQIQSGLGEATHNIQITCESDIAGTYASVASGDFGDGSGGSAATYSGLTTTVTLTEVGEGRYEVDDMSFGLYEQGYGDTSPSGRIDDICDSIVDVGDADQYGDPFTITGSRDPGTGVITIQWSNTYGDTGNVTLTPQ